MDEECIYDKRLVGSNKKPPYSLYSESGNT